MGETDPNKLFLRKLYNTRNVLTDEKMFYNPSDLNTHCVITGMTGSGKTGLGILLLEEIALKKIPTIIIDPKGDLTNLLLHFPNMTGNKGPLKAEPGKGSSTVCGDRSFGGKS